MLYNVLMLEIWKEITKSVAKSNHKLAEEVFMLSVNQVRIEIKSCSNCINKNERVAHIYMHNDP